MNLQREIDIAEQVAREAGDILLGYYQGEVRVELKAPSEPVTEADRAANRHIVQRLRQAFPQDGILAEESAADLVQPGAARIWMVDPMDGTKEFIKHTDEFAAMIGLAIAGRPRLGVVNQPATGTLYRGIVGDGAERVTDSETRPMQVRQEADLSQLRLICSRSHLPDNVRRMMQELGIQDMLRSGSVGLKIGKIATRACDLYLHPSLGTKLWDACAPEAILHAAGGQITDFDGQPVAYDPYHLDNTRGLLASNGASHAQIVRRLRGLY